MPFLKKITGSGHSHSRSGSASSIKTWSLESPSSSDKQGSRSGKSSKKPVSFEYRGSVASTGSYGSSNGFTQRLPAVPNLDVGSHGSEILSSSQLCGKHVTESTDGGSDSRKSSGGSVNSLSGDRLILSWDTTDPDEWTMQRVLSWLKFHEFPESWIDFFRIQQLSGHNFIKLLAYENFAVYEKFLRQPSTACYSRFQYLLKETMTQNVTNNHIRRRSLEKSKGSRSSSESLKSRQKKNRKHEELSSSRSTSESALLSAKSPSFNEDDKISTVPLRSHQKTTSAGALYRRSLISLRGSSSGNLLEGKPPTNIKLSIPSRPHSIVDSNEVSAKSGSPPSSPYYPGIFRRHQKSSSSESSLLNTLFGSTSNNNLDDEVEKLNHQKLDVATEGSSKSKTNLHETNSSINARQTSGIVEEKSSLWGKLRRRSQLVGLANIPQTPHSQVPQLKASNSANTEVESPSDASIGTLTPSDCDLKTTQRASYDVSNHGVSKQTPKSNDKSKNYSPKLFLLDRKFYPLKSKDAQDDKYILITKDNRSFIPLNIGMIQTLDELKESIILMLGINHSKISLHLTDFGCEIGSALPDDVLDTLRSSLFLNTAGKLFIKDQAGGKTRTRAATVGNETNQNLRSSQSRTSFRSVTNNMINSNDEVSVVSSSSDITSFDDLASGPIRRYPQTPNHYCETVSSNNGEELTYWNCKDTLPETGKSPRPLRSSSLAQKDKITVPELPMEKGRIGTFQILRKDDGNEIDFNKRRESPYIQPKLAPRREAPKPPTNSSPQRSSSTSSQLQIPRLRRSSTNRQVASNSKLSVKTNISESNDAVSPSADSVVNSYTPGSSHVLVPQPYKGVSEGSRKSKSEQDQVLNPVSTFISRQRSNRSNSIASNTSSVMNVRSPPLKKGNSKRIISSASAADVFEENDVTFSDAPDFSDPEDDSSQSSDEIIWSDRVAKPEDKNEQEIQSVSSAGTSETESNVPFVTSGDTNEQNGLDRKMTLRPSPEVVYQNLEKFFPHANLDKPVLEGVTPPVSPKSADSMGMSKAFEPEVKTDDTSVSSSLSRRPLEIPYKTEKTVRKDRLLKRAKTIRTIAHEASEARKQSMKLRRQNTKLWGTRTVEVTDKRMVSINKSKNSRGQYKEFAWIKGEMIGKGSFGAVYLCLNVTTGEMMAVKQVEVPRFGSQNEAMLHTVEALRAEVSTLKNLDHLNIVQYLGFEVKDNINSLFLEYVAGGSVGSLIRMYGRFDELMIKHLTTQVLSGLAYLHSRGILHRDMKADNLLLDQEGVCKISDFGISRKSQDIYSNSEMTMRGTVFWMAPEMVDTAQGYSAKVDIWSVGCVVLEMLAGKRPWSNLEVVAAMFKIGKSKSAPPIPEDTLPLISQSGRDFLDACFEVDPEARPTADELLRHPFLHLGHAFDFKSTKLAKLIRSNDRVNSTRLRVSSQDKSQATGLDRSLDVPINT